jgi:molybdate/tungstate transport system substrate-binding protein
MMKAAWAGLGLSLTVLAVTPAVAETHTVNVMYAGSLLHLMENSVGPAFQKETGLTFAGYAGGSNKLANEIKGKLRRADVFISASPKVNASLTGAANGDWVRWYVNFAESPLLIGYNAHSPYAAALTGKRWDQALQQPGIRIGRTDPRLDPKGVFTVELLQRAAVLYHQPDLMARTLGTPDNPKQVLPEETLIGRLQSGQLDVGFFYSTETSDLKIPAVKLPAELAAKASYTLTIVRDAPDQTGAERFVAFLLGPKGRELLRQHGIDVVVPTVVGDRQTLPATVQSAVSAAR